MEMIYKPVCESCDSSFDPLNLGYGITSSKYSGFNIPCLCRNCSNFVEVDLYTRNGSIKRKFTCPTCKTKVLQLGSIDYTTEPNFDYNKYLWIDFFWDGSGCVVEQRTYVIENKPYQCPKCEKTSLNFKLSEKRMNYD